MALHIDNAFEGVFKDDLDFSYGSGTSVLFRCEVTLREELTYLRGYDNHVLRIIFISYSKVIPLTFTVRYGIFQPKMRWYA